MSNKINPIFNSTIIVGISFFVSLFLMLTFSIESSTGVPLLQGTPSPAVFLPVIQGNPAISGTAQANQPPIVNAGLDQSVTLSTSVNLNGTVTDDGLPAPAKLTTQWKQLSGPGTVTFANPNVEDTIASFSLSGEYVLQLTANDSEAAVSDQVNITVNQPPTVEAGVDQTILLPANAQLNGTVSDDGLPNPPGKLSLRWSKLNGPGTVTFTNADAENTTATFSLAGNYMLLLTADDSAQPKSDLVQITVITNQPPTVDAGADQTVTVLDSVQLTGTASDDGLPNPPGTLSFTWSKLSGPGTVTFANPNTVATSATFAEVGVYILRLTANDSALTTFDEIAITVNNSSKAKRIAFTSSRGGSRDIYLMNADGTGIVNLTNNSAFDASASWSPDGAKIAFVSDRDNQALAKTEIYVMNVNGSGQTRLTNNASAEYALAWSPDGAKIAFVSNGDGNGEIYIMNADGSGQTRLTNNTKSDWGPSWSPDSAKITYGSGGDIYVMNADGSKQTRLTNSSLYESEPAWSPNGAKIAYAHDNAIWLMSADGSGQAELTSGPNRFDFDPAWSPDGTEIAFASFLNGSTDDVFVVNLDGSGRTNITDNEYNDLEPDWQP